jgi:ATP-dependent DNA ligase
VDTGFGEPTSHPREAGALAADGAVVFAKVCELGLEGIVSKRAGSFYRSGKASTG